MQNIEEYTNKFRPIALGLELRDQMPAGNVLALVERTCPTWTRQERKQLLFLTAYLALTICIKIDSAMLFTEIDYSDFGVTDIDFFRVARNAFSCVQDMHAEDVRLAMVGQEELPCTVFCSLFYCAHCLIEEAFKTGLSSPEEIDAALVQICSNLPADMRKDVLRLAAFVAGAVLTALSTLFDPAILEDPLKFGVAHAILEQHRWTTSDLEGCLFESGHRPKRDRSTLEILRRSVGRNLEDGDVYFMGAELRYRLADPEFLSPSEVRKNYERREFSEFHRMYSSFLTWRGDQD